MKNLHQVKLHLVDAYFDGKMGYIGTSVHVAVDIRLFGVVRC